MGPWPPIAVAPLFWREEGLKHWEVNWLPRWDKVWRLLWLLCLFLCAVQCRHKSNLLPLPPHSIHCSLAYTSSFLGHNLKNKSKYLKQPQQTFDRFEANPRESKYLPIWFKKKKHINNHIRMAFLILKSWFPSVRMFAGQRCTGRADTVLFTDSMDLKSDLLWNACCDPKASRKHCLPKSLLFHHPLHEHCSSPAQSYC